MERSNLFQSLLHRVSPAALNQLQSLSRKTRKFRDSPTAKLTINLVHSAAKTALLLDNTQLGSSHVQVTSAAGIDEIAGSKTTTETTEELEQEDKPRSRIIAEYLAHGYIIGDTAIQRAVEFDDKNGISSKFAQTLQNFDQKLKATDKAKSLDTSYGVTNKATKGWMGLQSYFEKAAGTPTGQKVVAFYTQGSKQVQDIHAEARRLADLKKQHGVTSGTIYEDGKAEAAAVIPDTSKLSSSIIPASATEKETAIGTEKPGI